MTTPIALAQSYLRGLQGLAEYVRIEGEVNDGQIVALEQGKHVLAHEAYSGDVYGVVNLKPAVAYSQIGRDNAYPIVASGTTKVLVSAKNGNIEPGDYITSSDDPGIGMKATEAGFVLGTASEAFSADQGETGLISVVISIKFLSSLTQDKISPRAFAAQLNNALTVGMRAVASEPNTAMRYAAAILILVASIGFGFMVFGRAATNGIIAIGRNPLARKSIFAVVVFNIVITVSFVAAGLVLSFLVLAL
ncbi:MAG: hypothetical protein U1C49_02325 [Candidatus Andersenbacteria bacterium]|nr:hypothetical protein [bacterium]MDZ4225664.1 hypothetical protein [Candidatus Andersenbacteria bacterium]